MSGNLQDDVRKFILEIEESKNNGETLAQLTKLQKETAKYRQENEELQKVMAHLASKGEKNGKVYKEMEAKLKSNRVEIRKNSDQMKGLEKNLDLVYMTSGQLQKRIIELRSALSTTSKKVNPKEWNRLNTELQTASARMNELKGRSNQAKGVLGKLKGAAAGFLPALAPVAVIAAIKRISQGLFKLTSQIQGETIRSTTVLGNQLGYVEDQADKLAEKMGVTNREFVSMVANTGDLLIPLDFTRKKAAEMATQVQSLAGALDEWTAGKYGVAEVSEILTKAMLGEMEQLKGLGIAIRQDSKEFRDLVKQKEQAEGATNAQARAMATLELLFKKSADAQAAYLAEGNKLLRWQKAVRRRFQEMKETIATGWAESMKSATQQFSDQQREVNSLESSLQPLLSKYEELSEKQIPLTESEQATLNDTIRAIGKIVPTAITQFDEYGNAIGISATKAEQFIEAQQAMLKIMNADAIRENEAELQKVKEQYENIQKILQNGTETVSSQSSGFGGVNIREVELTDKRIKEFSKSLVELGEKRLGYETILKSLKGDPITPTIEEEDEATKSLIQAKEDELKVAKNMPETTKAEIAAKNRKIAAIEKEIDRLRELGIQSKNSLKLAEFLAASDEEQKLAIERYFSSLGDNAFEAFMAAIEENQKLTRGDFSIVPDFEQEETDDPALDYGVQKYKETLEFRFALNQSMYEKGLIGEQQYQDQLTALTRKAEEQRFQIREEKIRQAQQLSNMATNFVMSLMELELAKAGDNEEEKKKIRKKYADLNFAVTASQIIADTASAIMKALATLGPIAGPIAAGIVGATGALQLGIANAERKKVKGYAGGGYANEEQYIVSEKNKPEWVGPNWMLNDPFSGGLINFLESYRQNPAQVRSVAASPVSSPPVSNIAQPYTYYIDVDKFDKAVTRLENLKIPFSYDQFAKLEDEYKRQQQGSGM